MHGDGWTAPWLFLLDADGRYVAPRIPVDGCGKPLGWYRERGTAWGVLAYSDRVVGPSKDLAEQVGCPAAQADVVGALSSSSHRRAGAFVGDPFAGRPLRFCVYDASGAGGEPGPFVTGQSLVPDERAAFLAALASAPESTGPCSSEDGQVAVVGPRDGSANVFVELGGCRRVVERDRLDAGRPRGGRPGGPARRLSTIQPQTSRIRHRGVGAGSSSVLLWSVRYFWQVLLLMPSELEGT